MADTIPPSKKALEESLQLTEEILRNIELGEISLSAVVLKACRLARLLNDFEAQQIFEYESSGYPFGPDGVHPEAWKLARIAGRVYKGKEKEKGKEVEVERAYVESISALEGNVETSQVAITAAKDPDVSLSSSNPNQFLIAPMGNSHERRAIRSSAATARKQIAERRSFLHKYVSKRHYELKLSGIADDIFSRVREKMDPAIGKVVPSAIQKLSAIYDNLRSENPEDWSNAAHSCRRMLQDLADAISPATNDRTVLVGGKQKTIKMGPDNYINRLMAFIEDHSASEKFTAIVGSHLSFIGERIDAIFEAAQKGSHAVITDRDEADRYVIYTYLIVGDILSLRSET